MAISSKPATRAGGSKTAPEAAPPIATPTHSAPRRHRRRENFRPPPLSLLWSGYALASERQRRRILILIVAMPWPRRFMPAGGHYWTRKGVAIGPDLTVGRGVMRVSSSTTHAY